MCHVSMCRLSSAFGPPWILASGDMPKPCPRSFRVSPEAWEHSSDQILVSEPPPRDAIDEDIQAIEGVALHVAFIEAKRELVNVTVQVLVACVVVDAVQAALQDGPNALNPVVVTPSRTYSPALWTIVSWW